MTGSRTASAALPLRRGGAGGALLLFWAFSLMVYVAGLGGVGLLVISHSEAAWRRTFATTMTLEVPADTSPARLATVLALLKQTRGVTVVRLLTTPEEARLLVPWLGPGAQLDGLPLPRLIDLRSDAPGSIDLAGLRAKLASLVPDAQLDDHAQWLGDLQRAARRLQLVVVAGIAAALLAIAPTAIFAAGGAFAADEAVLRLAYRLGATDHVMLRPFVLAAYRLGLSGGALGGLAVIATLAALDRTPLLQHSLVAMIGPADWRPWAIVAAIALSAGLIAAAAARASIARRLAIWP
jgi:cell division transport system permease protein